MRQKDQGSRKTEIKTKKVKEEGKKEPKRSKTNCVQLAGIVMRKRVHAS